MWEIEVGMNKGGWIRILEATVAVLIVSGVMIAVYSDQSVKEEITIEEYSYSMQAQILADVVLRSDLRLAALRTVEDLPGDPNYDILDEFVNDSIPDSFGYLLRVCELGSDEDFCKMDGKTFLISLEKDVFVEEVVISAEIGDGSGEEIYSPKKVKLFFWEGGFPDGYCRDVCVAGNSGSVCSDDNTQVVSEACEDSDGDGCLDDGVLIVLDNCDDDQVCFAGVCINSLYKEWDCGSQVVVDSGCVSNFDDECDDYDGGESTGSCGMFDEAYECWDMVVQETTTCELSPACSGGYTFIEERSCDPGCVDECSAGDVNVFCSADFSQVLSETCGNFDGDVCLEFSGSSVDANCGAGQICEGAACVDLEASLTAAYVLGAVSGNDYYYDVTLTESNGVGVSIDSGERCFENGDCISYSPSFVIPAGGSTIRSDQHFTTALAVDTAVYTYSGTDDNGNAVSVSFSISTSEY